MGCHRIVGGADDLAFVGNAIGIARDVSQEVFLGPSLRHAAKGKRESSCHRAGRRSRLLDLGC